MGRYEPLARFLADKDEPRWQASFADVEKVLGFPLPKSARRYPAWWANQNNGGHSQTAGWQGAGWRTRNVDLAEERVDFERAQSSPARKRRPNANSQPSTEWLFRRATELTGIVDRDRLISRALEALVQHEAALRLSRLGGTMKDYRAPPRRRPRAA